MTEPERTPEETAFVHDLTATLIQARRDGQADGITALRQLRARLELVEPPHVVATTVQTTAIEYGFHQALQACRAEAATVLAQLLAVTAATHPTTPPTGD